VTYFIGRVLPSANARLSHESTDMKWLSLDELRDFVKFRSEFLLPLIEEVNDYLKQTF